jgi:Protein of unknown function (DUF732)
MRTTIIAAAVALAALAVAAAPAAAADDRDAAYLNAIHARGITATGGDASFLDLAHTVCRGLGQGLSMNALIYELQMHEGGGATDDDMAFLVKSATVSYCPQYIK